MLPPTAECSSRMNTWGPSSLLEDEDLEGACSIFGDSNTCSPHLLLLPAHSGHSLDSDLMSHCLEHVKSQGLLFGIKSRVTMVRGSLQIVSNYTSLLITISWLVAKGNAAGFGLDIAANDFLVVSEQQGASATSC